MKKVLIVEDVAEMRGLLEQLVSKLPGFGVSGLASNGWEARMELGRRKPDLVLLDEVLPGESSVDLLAEIKAEGVPVLLITGMEEPHHPIPAGAAGRVIKPGWDNFEEGGKRLLTAMLLALSG